MATEKRLIIYADDLIKCLKKHDRRIPGIPWSITGIQNILKELKPVDAVQVVHGRWVWRDGCFHCTNCKYTEDHITNYCPNCGADMRGNGNG